jgi:TolB-like protein
MPDSPSSSIDEAPGGADVIAPEVVVLALTAILDSEAFRSAPRSRDFLAYIVTEHLAGRGDRLGEHAVARHALGRADYDARLNSSVRVQATRLRAALQRYYSAEGVGATVRISLPPGTYAPVVARHDPGQDTSTSPDDVAVAVLRFASTGPGADLLSSTLCDAIVHRLGDFSGLTVIGPSRLDPTGTDAASRQLGARFVLEGRVTSSEDAVALEARLGDVTSGDVAWRIAECVATADLDGSRLDDRWAAAVAGQVGDATGVIFRRALARDEHTGSAVHAARLAYTDYLMKGTGESVAAAATALDRALGQQSTAELLAMRGAIHNAEVNQGTTATERERELYSAERLARDALALDPDSAAAYLVLAGTAWQRQQWDLAHRHATRAVDLAPWNPTILMSAGTVQAVAGDWTGGAQTLRRGFRINPVHPGSAHSVTALACLIAGDDASALAEASLVHVPGQLWGPLYRALALAALGYREQAWAEMAQVLELDPTFLEDPATYFTERARFSTCELETLLAHFEPFRAPRFPPAQF